MLTSSTIPNDSRRTHGMPVATPQDLCTQKYVRHWIYNLIPPKARERSLVDET